MSEPSSRAKREIDALSGAVQDEFTSTRQVLSFEEWFDLLLAEPSVHARNAAQYLKAAFDHFGRRPVRTPGGQVERFILFDCDFDGWHRLVGQEEAQNELYEAIAGFVRVGRVNKLLLLHGPNGSAKSTMLESIQRALEAYSHTEKGALYCFSWVFPTQKAQKGGGRTGIGFSGGPDEELLDKESFARLSGEEIDSRVTDELRDHPLFLLPLELRSKLLANIGGDDFVMSDAVAYGQLNHRNRKIFEALLGAYKGDLRKVLRHVQVERFYLSRNYRTGLVTVEPKQTVDARSFPVTGDRAFAHLPPTVAGQVLYGSQGDLVDANRGIINFSDLLKRPYEHYKYLLTVTETGRIALDHVVLGLDVVFTGSANDLNLVEFRSMRPGEYQAFRGRLDLIKVPFLLDYRVERKIYQEQVGDLLRGLHIAPHVSRILALWGVMTRLRRPNAEKYPEKLKGALERLSPLEKADLYAYGRVPRGLSSEEARELLAAVPSMYREAFGHVVVRAEGSDTLLGDYEGSFGASVRDLKAVLLAAAADVGTRNVTVPRLFAEIRKYLEDRANHRWMMLEGDDAGFHNLDDGKGSITLAAWDRWVDLSDREVREALGLIDEARYMELFRKYVLHASHFLKRERLFDPITGELTEPDKAFMAKLEKTMDPSAGDDFRADILSRVGAWALSHPDEEPAYDEIFPDYFARLRDDYYEKQKDVVRRSIGRMLAMLSDDKASAPADGDSSLTAAEEDKAKHAVEVLLGEHDGDDRRERHTRDTLKETLVYLSKERY